MLEEDRLIAATPRQQEEVIDRAIPETVIGFMEDRDEGAPDYAELLNWVNTTFQAKQNICMKRCAWRSYSPL